MKSNRENNHQRSTPSKREDLEKIVYDLNKAIGDSPDNAQLYHQLGMSYEALKRFKEAIDAYYLALFFSKKPGNIFAAVKLRVKIMKLKRKLKKEQVSYEGPLLFQMWILLKGGAVSILLAPLWVLALTLLNKRSRKISTIIIKSMVETNSFPFIVLFCILNLILLYEVFKSLILRCGYNLKYKLTFSLIKIGVFSLATPLGIYILSLTTAGMVDLMFFKVFISKNTIPLYVIYVSICLLESFLQLMNALIKMTYFKKQKKSGLFYNPKEVHIETFTWLSKSMKRRFSKTDVILILELKDRYKKKVDRTSHPDRVKKNEMFSYIQNEVKKKGMEVTKRDINKILRAEEISLDWYLCRL